MSRNRACLARAVLYLLRLICVAAAHIVAEGAAQSRIDGRERAGLQRGRDRKSVV